LKNRCQSKINGWRMWKFAEESDFPEAQQL
jgi:hypothetical protein